MIAHAPALACCSWLSTTTPRTAPGAERHDRDGVGWLIRGTRLADVVGHEDPILRESTRRSPGAMPAFISRPAPVPAREWRWRWRHAWNRSSNSDPFVNMKKDRSRREEEAARLRAEHHEEACATSGLWFMQASELFLAAENLVRRATCLDPSSQTHDLRVLGPGLMLRGLGVENLLKALFVFRGGTLGMAGKAGDMPCRHHDLPRMAAIAAARRGTIAADASLLPTEDELPMLSTLHTCLVWAGRYPIPRSPDDVILSTNTERDMRAFWSRRRECLFEAFARRLVAYLYRDRVTSPGRRTCSELVDQCLQGWVCREWIRGGGVVGNRPLRRWGVSVLTFDQDIRL